MPVDNTSVAAHADSILTGHQSLILDTIDRLRESARCQKSTASLLAFDAPHARTVEARGLRAAAAADRLRDMVDLYAQEAVEG
jgi:hypothetical protein